MSMFNDKIYQKIFDELSPYLYDEWEKVVFYAEYGNTTYSMSFYVKVKNVFIKCYDMNDVVEEQLYKTFKIIDKIISKEQKNDKWTNMTMVVSSNGKMKTDFDYSDLTTTAYQHKKEWKSKHLK